MVDSVYKVIELVGTSPKSWEDAAKAAVPRRIAPIREYPGQLVGQTETPLGHRQKHHAPIRGQAPTIEGSCDFLGVNGWK